MSWLVEKLQKGRCEGLDSEIRIALLDLWDRSGSQVTWYRNLTSHKAIIVSGGTLYRERDGLAHLRLVLPNKTDEKRPINLNYHPGVPAMSFVFESLESTLVAANRIVERLIDLLTPGNPDARKKGIINIPIRGGFIFGIGVQIEGEPIPYPRDLNAVVREASRIRVPRDLTKSESSNESDERATE